ncbi:unnamed protein product [Cuscuta epithymum]|uniref:Uncharacterized protein n=1 Tax=Cuscuta epithymum TaxID=186058 RepID=A0AAV0DHK0_9ASTE|nr:unnamed protein product [Cuscuta epithymum]
MRIQDLQREMFDVVKIHGHIEIATVHDALQAPPPLSLGNWETISYDELKKEDTPLSLILWHGRIYYWASGVNRPDAPSNAAAASSAFNAPVIGKCIVGLLGFWAAYLSR